jgi:DNA-binding GntR family transcriptional regulator
MRITQGGRRMTTGEPSARERAAILADGVYAALRQDILHGVLRPNEALVEADVAERLHVSRTPVRESMQRLATEGMIVSRRRRWYVYEHSREEIQQIYEARAALEGYAARLAAERAPDELLVRVRTAHAVENGYPPTGRAQVDANDRFHDMVIEASGNPRIKAMIEGNRQYYFNFRIAESYTPAEIAAWHGEHQLIVDAICARDGDSAERASRAHVLGALQLILAKFY